MGSSPLTRGKLEVHAHAQVVDRLIPAHAGKTDVPLSREEMKRAHPRSRGENRVIDVYLSGLRGSSPLTRGKLRPSGLEGGHDGLIPAHAGKTATKSSSKPRGPAHPRSRGENEIARAEDVNANGSSPLTRGKRLAVNLPWNAYRLIPAHAGKTLRRYSGIHRWPAHPRSRGENFWLHCRHVTRAGSSPLTRGKPWKR